MSVPTPYFRVVMCLAPFVMIVAAVSGATAQSGRADLSEFAVLSGRNTFRQFCSPCHGLNAKGDGPIATMLTTPPSDLTRVRVRNDGEFPLGALERMLTLGVGLQTMAHGSEQMPVWGPTFIAIDGSESLAKVRIANLLAYLESIQGAAAD